MSAERDHELERLATAERHVAEAERQLAEQLDRIEKLGGDDQAAKDAEKLLVPLHDLLTDWSTQRDVIVERIKELDQQNR